MKSDIPLREVYRYMLLPTLSGNEDVVIAALKKKLSDVKIDDADQPVFVKEKYQEWQETGILDATLKEVIATSLEASSSTYGKLLVQDYFTIHTVLLKNPLFDFKRAVIVLSHLHFIISMASQEKMSATKISTVLKTIDGRLSFVSWKDIQNILRILKLMPELKQTSVEELYEEDVLLQIEDFADSSMEDASYQLGEVARQLQLSANAERSLNTLSSNDTKHLPYLQMLHYQCVIAGFYDHILSSLYEFAPRGNIANWIFAKWDNVVSTSNPFLNNAKAVTALDVNWATSRDNKEFEAAMVLVDLLKGLDGMGFAAAQELTSWIRRWLIRFINITETAVVPVPSGLNSAQQMEILSYIANAPTATFGILEQRLVDVISAVLHSEQPNWRSRGLGDAVNSNNLSKKKLGDSDFQNIQSYEIIAYEAHGGVLSKLYVDGHLRTLIRSLSARSEELIAIADVGNWSIKVKFIAYGFEKDLPVQINIGGYLIHLYYITFSDLLSQINPTSDLFREQFQKYFIEVINNRRTPSIVREKIIALLPSR